MNTMQIKLQGELGRKRKTTTHIRFVEMLEVACLWLSAFVHTEMSKNISESWKNVLSTNCLHSKIRFQLAEGLPIQVDLFPHALTIL